MNTLTPYEYRVRAWPTGHGVIERPRDLMIKAWTAEDAFVQTEILLGIRGKQMPAWSIAKIEPYHLNPGESLFGEIITGG